MDNKEIHRICKKYGIVNYTIEDGLVNVDWDVHLYNIGFDKLPLAFGIVSGNFWCNNNNLKSLEGSPREVGKTFYCQFNNLKSLNGAPLKVGGDFYCYDNPKELSYEKYLLKTERLNKLKQLND